MTSVPQHRSTVNPRTNYDAGLDAFLAAMLAENCEVDWQIIDRVIEAHIAADADRERYEDQPGYSESRERTLI